MCDALRRLMADDLQRAEEQGIERGIKQGIEQGLEQGIVIFVEDKLEDNIPEDAIIEKVHRKFNVPMEKAQEYVKRCQESFVAGVS
jgi:flagellar biosynthesis/type III secretory pathway protein FliH